LNSASSNGPEFVARAAEPGRVLLASFNHRQLTHSGQAAFYALQSADRFLGRTTWRPATLDISEDFWHFFSAVEDFCQFFSAPFGSKFSVRDCVDKNHRWQRYECDRQTEWQNDVTAWNNYLWDGVTIKVLPCIIYLYCCCFCCFCCRLTDAHKSAIRVMRRIRYFVAKRKFQVHFLFRMFPAENSTYVQLTIIVFSYFNTKTCIIKGLVLGLDRIKCCN